ncbi:MAG: SDR family oxidoreductase [Candidatus Aminicenantes bacterium]|nr:SDR family oxidoreductase [Candidatus Aminicenantes bacterium]
MTKKTGELSGKVAVVTGGGRGIGRGIATQLAKAGANVIVADSDSKAALETAKILTEGPSRALHCHVDVADAKSVASMVQLTLDAFGRLDILVNNAGIMFRTRLMKVPLEEWENTIKVNLTGPFICTMAVLPVMKKQAFGRIVNISSSAGRSVSTLGGVHYTASKAGLLGLTRAVAKEAAAFGVTVNAVCPGLIDTQMVRKTTTKEELKMFLNSFPVSRIGKPEEIGDLVTFLCSEKSAYITGASIDINGGDLMI